MRCLGLLLVALAFADVGGATAQDAAPPAPPASAERAPTAAGRASAAWLEQQTRTIASQLRCPVCQGLSLQDSPTELAQEMRDVIRTQLAEGRSPDQVKAYFVGRYGEWILLQPEPRGFNLMVYVLPLVMLVGGGAVVLFALRRWTRADGAATETAAVEDQSTVNS